MFLYNNVPDLQSQDGFVVFITGLEEQCKDLLCVCVPNGLTPDLAAHSALVTIAHVPSFVLLYPHLPALLGTCHLSIVGCPPSLNLLSNPASFTYRPLFLHLGWGCVRKCVRLCNTTPE